MDLQLFTRPGFTGFCCTVIFSPCSKGFQKDLGSAFQSFEGWPGGTIIQAHVDLFPFINTHSKKVRQKTRGTFLWILFTLNEPIPKMDSSEPLLSRLLVSVGIVCEIPAL